MSRRDAVRVITDEQVADFRATLGDKHLECLDSQVAPCSVCAHQMLVAAQEVLGIAAVDATRDESAVVRAARPMADIMAEVERATAKFPTWPTDPLHALAVLGEEFGELTKAVLQGVYEPHKNKPDEIRKEAIQTAAMAVRFLASLQSYQYTRSVQHTQAALTAAPAAQPAEVCRWTRRNGLLLAECGNIASGPWSSGDTCSFCGKRIEVSL